MAKRHFATAVLLAGLLLLPFNGATSAPSGHVTADTPRHLTPDYPLDRDCSPLTSLFSSWDDVDGNKRDAPHTGVDGGRLGDAVLAPAPGEVIAVWHADWGWGPEGALMLRHTREELGLSDGPKIYYSEFDHLRYDEIARLRVGTRIKRGQVLAHVDRPGGDEEYLPEVHLEVWSIQDEGATQWDKNEHGGKYWVNETGHLIDPLYMMSLNASARRDHSVAITPFDATRDYTGFRGFTYFLPCPALKAKKR